MRISALSRSLFLCSMLLVSANAVAQFGIDAPEQPAAETESTAQNDQLKDDELIRQLESNASRGGRYLWTAIASLTRLGAWDAVDRWLATLNEVDDENELTRAAETIGPQLLLRISLREGLSDASRSALQKLFDASRSTKQAPARLNQAIDQLATTNVDQNLAATRVLMQGGNASAEAIVDRIAAGVDGRHRRKLLSLLDAFGDGGVQALRQLSLYGTQDVRAPALDALALLEPSAAIDNLLTARFAADATDREVAVAARRLGTGGQFRRSDAIAVLSDRLASLRRIAKRTANDEKPVFLWSIDADRTGVTPARSSEIFLHYRRSYDAAQRLLRVGGLPNEVFLDVLAADLAYRVMADVEWGSPEQVQQLRKNYGDLVSVDVLIDALHRTRQIDDVPGTLGLLRMLAQSKDFQSQAEPLLRPRGSDAAELVAAARDANPRVRYEAAALITDLLKAAPTLTSFPGASYYRRTLAEMAELRNNPTAVLLETRPIVALRQENILSQLGYETRTATKGLQVERMVSQGGDIRLVVSKIEPADITAAELVDRIRRLEKGRNVPIVFYHDDDTHPKTLDRVQLETTSTRWNRRDAPSVYLVPLPGAPAALSEALSEVADKRRMPPLSTSERQRFRLIGQAGLEGELAHR